MNALLEVRGLHVGIGGVQVVRDLDLSLVPGERLAVLGRNGVGKSTLLQVLAGLRAAQAGELLVAGRNLHACSARELARARAWLPQGQDDAFPASVLDTVLVGRHPWLGRFDWESEQDEHIARAALDELGLTGFETRDITALSGGERQRVAIAAMLAQQALLMLADEPLSYLDPGHQMRALDCLRARTQRGAALAVVLHDVNLALRACERFLLLFGGGDFLLADRDVLDDCALIERTLGYPVRRLVDGTRPYFVPA